MKKLIYSALVIVMSALTLTSCEDVPAPYDLPTDNGGTDNPDQPSAEATGTGTAADPFNVAAAVKYITDGGSEDTEMYVKGIVVSVVSGSYDASYGSLKYYISDDGTSTDQFYVYNGYAAPNRTKFKSEEDLKAGDEVIICGKLITYNGTKEFQTGNYLVSLNGKSTTGGTDTPDTPSTGEATGDGTLANPFNSVAANNYAATLANGAVSEQDYYIKGKVVSVRYEYDTSYGTGTFYISDDGTSNGQFYVYRAYYLENKKFVEGNTQPKAGDEVIVCGKITNYYSESYGNTYETATGKAYLYSLNGKTTASETTGGEDKPAETNAGITIDGTTVTLTNSAVTAGTESITYDVSKLGQDKASEVTTITLSDGTTITFDGNGETNTPKFYTTEIRVYKNNAITITGHKAIAKVIFTCSGTDRVGNNTATLTTSGNSLTYTNTYTEESGGGVQLRVKTIEIIYAK